MWNPINLLRGLTISKAERLQAIERGAATAKQGAVETFLRNWDSANNNRITQGHWAEKRDAKINEDIANELETIRSRSRYEIQNNGWVEGVMESMVTDIVGKNGPVLQISAPKGSQAELQRARQAEKIWNEWWANPDISGTNSGVDLLGVGIRSWFRSGEFFWHIVSSREDTAVKTRLQALSPERIVDPYTGKQSPLQSNGITFNENWRPISYTVSEGTPSENSYDDGYSTREIPARSMLHFFIQKEEGQSRGTPVLASVLNIIAQMRDFESDTMQAVRMAAMLAILLESDDTDAQVPPLTGSMDLERGMMTALPPGVTATQVNPQHPSSNFTAFTDHCLSEIFRPVGAPLMIAKLDSKEHSFSSARFDGQTYDRNIKSIQGVLDRKIMNKLLGIVFREAQLTRNIQLPANWSAKWVWPTRPHVDPGKEASANETLLKNGITSKAEWAAANGSDIDQVNAARERENLSPIPVFQQEINAQDKTAEAAQTAAQPQPEPEEPEEVARSESYLSSTILCDDEGKMYVAEGDKVTKVGNDD